MELKVAETFTKLQGIEIDARELVEEWILITYDIPVTDEGKEARLKFLKTAPRIGAMMHSRSVYLMPDTQQAQLASVELSKIDGAEVYLWTSKVDGDQAVQLTDFYDKKIQEQIETIDQRIIQEEILVKDEKFGMADRMHRKTSNLFSQICFTVTQRGATSQVIQKLTKIKNKITAETKKRDYLLEASRSKRREEAEVAKVRRLERQENIPYNALKLGQKRIDKKEKKVHRDMDSYSSSLNKFKLKDKNLKELRKEWKRDEEYAHPKAKIQKRNLNDRIKKNKEKIKTCSEKINEIGMLWKFNGRTKKYTPTPKNKNLFNQVKTLKELKTNLGLKEELKNKNGSGDEELKQIQDRINGFVELYETSHKNRSN